MAETLALRPDLRWSQVGAELVVLDAELGELLRLNPVAGLIWQELAQGRGLKQIVAALCRQFAVEPAAAEADARAFLEELRGLELVVDEKTVVR